MVQISEFGKKLTDCPTDYYCHPKEPSCLRGEHCFCTCCVEILSQAFGTQYIHSNVSFRPSSWKDWVVLCSDPVWPDKPAWSSKSQNSWWEMATRIKGNVFLLCLIGNTKLCKSRALHASSSAQSTHRGLSLKKTNQASDSRCISEIMFSLSFSSLSQPPTVFPEALNWTMLMGMCSSTVLLLCF